MPWHAGRTTGYGSAVTRGQSPDRRRIDWRRLAGPAAITIAVLAWFGPLLGGGEVLALRDTLLDFLPWREYTARALSDGALPLWSHESRMGQAFLAQPQSAVFYPPHLLWLVLPSTVALVLTQCGHLLLAGLGAFLLARRVELRVAPAVVAAAGWTFSTYTIAQMEFLPAFETVCWGPLTLLLADRVAERVRDRETVINAAGRPVVALALAWGTQALAGHPQALFQNVVLVAVFCAVRIGIGRRLARTLAFLTAAGLLGAALAAPQLLTSLAHLAESTRSGAIDSGAAEASVHPRYLVALIAPYIFGRPGYDGSWWQKDVFEFWAAICHVGVVPLLLAPLAALRRGRTAAAFAVITGIGVVLALGAHTPVYPFLAEHVPPFTRFRWPGKWLHLVAFALPFLGGLGLQVLLDATSERTRQAAIAIGGVVVIVVGAAYLAGDAEFYAALVGVAFDDPARLIAVRSEHARALVASSVTVAALGLLLRPRWRTFAAALLAGIALVDAGTQSRSLHGTVPSDVTTHVPDWVESAAQQQRMRVHSTHSLGQLWLYGQSAAPWYVWARDASLGEALLPLGVERTWGFGQLIPRRQWEAWELLQDPSLAPSERERVSDLLNVGLVIHGPPFDEAAMRAGRLPKLRVARRSTHLPRAFVVGESVVENEDPWRRLLDPAFDPRSTVVLSDAHPLKSATEGPTEPSKVTVTYGWNRIDVHVVSSVRGKLVLLEPYDVRWSVAGGGLLEQTPTRANGLFMSIDSEPGDHTYVFRYGEPALLAGCGIAGAALVALVLLTLGSVPCAPTRPNSVPPRS